MIPRLHGEAHHHRPHGRSLAERAEVIARGRGIAVNALMLQALEAEIERVRHDEEFMAQLRRLTERDKEILDRLAE